MTLARINDENLLPALALICALTAIVLSIAGWIFVSADFAGGVFAGGCVALTNFYWLRNALTKILRMPAEQATNAANFRYILRLAATGFILWLLIVKVGLNIFGLLLGLSVLVIGIMLLTVYRLLHSGG
jgi:ATP synthase I chain